MFGENRVFTKLFHIMPRDISFVQGYNNEKLDKLRYITNAEVTLKHPVEGTEDYMNPHFMIQSKNHYAVEFCYSLLHDEAEKSVNSSKGLDFNTIIIKKSNIPIFIGKNGNEIRHFKRDMNLKSVFVMDHPYKTDLSVIKFIGTNLERVIFEFKRRYSNLL